MGPYIGSVWLMADSLSEHCRCSRDRGAASGVDGPTGIILRLVIVIRRCRPGKCSTTEL
jgi:hypothetical protein